MEAGRAEGRSSSRLRRRSLPCSTPPLLVGRWALGEEQVHVPHLIDPEVASALRRGVAASRIEPGDAWNALDRWRRLGMSRDAVFDLFDRVWELRENLSAYDATYVALAESLDCALLTADVGLGRTPGLRCPAPPPVRSPISSPPAPRRSRSRRAAP
ncbi:MAG: type II toxin-antitoxin system VapC family toxin [Acidimicrobiales bacterium]